MLTPTEMSNNMSSQRFCTSGFGRIDVAVLAATISMSRLPACRNISSTTDYTTSPKPNLILTSKVRHEKIYK